MTYDDYTKPRGMDPDNYKGDPELQALLRTMQTAEAPDKSAGDIVALAPQVTFLQQLHAVRRRAGFSQTVLAERVGMPQSAIARIESGKVQPTLKTLLKITDALGVSLTLAPKRS